MNLPFFQRFLERFPVRHPGRWRPFLTQYELMEIAALKVALGDAAWLQEVVMRMPEVVKDMELAMNQWPGRRFGTLRECHEKTQLLLTPSFFRGVGIPPTSIYIYYIFIHGGRSKGPCKEF